MLGALKQRWQEYAGTRALLAYLPKVSWPLTIALFGITLLSALAPVAFNIATGLLVGSIGEAVVRGGVTAAEANRAMGLAAFAAVMFAVPQLLGMVRGEVTSHLAGRVRLRLRQRILEVTTAPRGIAHLEEPKSHNQIEIARGMDGMTDPWGAVYAMGELGDRYIGAIAAALIVAAWHWWIAVTLTVLFLLSGGRIMRGFNALISIYTDSAGEIRRSEYLRNAALGPQAAKETRVFGLGRWLWDTYRQNWLEIYGRVWDQRRRATWVALPFGLAATLLAGLAMALATREATTGALSLGTFVIVVRSIFGMNAFSQRGQPDLQLKTGATAVPAIAALGEVARESGAELSEGTIPAHGLPRSSIRFEDVGFAYPGREPIFNRLSLEIPAGQSLAVVGSNGAGKTTLVKLLARLYDPTSGRITVDGTDLREIRSAEWQRQVAAIFQDFVRYPLPARDNVALAGPDCSPPDEALDEVARRAGAHEVIEKLESRWDTPLARNLTGGADISGGEWQRIALARALMAVKSGARVLILDEPTASLDVRAEAAFYDRFLELTTGVTCIVISHRFSTVRKADRIVVLEEGVVVEDGSHDELMALSGRYAASFNLQAARFGTDESVEPELATGAGRE